MHTEISKEQLEEIVLISNSFVEVTTKLGFNPKKGNIKKNIERKIKRLCISTEHFDSVKRVREYNLRYKDENLLSKLVENSSSFKEILLELDILPVGSNYGTLKKYLKRYNIDYSKFSKTNLKNKYDRDVLEVVVRESLTLKECLIKLGIRAAGSNYKHLRSYITKYDIDMSHFDPNAVRISKLKSVASCRKIPLVDLLKENIDYSRTSLKERLYKEGLLDRKCCLCGLDENWNGMKISLILDHINGVHNDNRIDNLRIVCPNCNAGLETFAGKNTKRIKKEYQCECGKEKSKGSTRCTDCQARQRRTTERPTYLQLIKEVEELGYRAVGRKYDVSDNAIRKWIKNELKTK